jgi:hypothetical protein
MSLVVSTEFNVAYVQITVASTYRATWKTTDMPTDHVNINDDQDDQGYNGHL